MAALSFSGVFAPLLTPVDADLNIDLNLCVEFCRWLLDTGCHGLVLVGTNSEATSFSVFERKAALDAVVAAGIPAEKPVGWIGIALLFGTGSLRHIHQFGVNIDCECVGRWNHLFGHGDSQDTDKDGFGRRCQPQTFVHRHAAVPFGHQRAAADG